MPSPCREPVGKVVGDYEILEEIAEGGMAVVYRGRQRTTGEPVAIKIVKPEVAANPVLVERFKQEFRAAQRLVHPHIVRALDYGTGDDLPFMVMEYVDGLSLGERIERHGRLPEEEAVRLICEVADALHLAHQNQIIHRDVKPDNILVDPDGRAKLTDLGLAKCKASDLDLTQPFKGLGTPNFMAPEQFGDAKHAGVRCDIYSLGATLHQMVTGEFPFNARSSLNILKKKLKNDLTPPRKLVPRLSERVDVAIRRAVRAEPEQRYGSCPEFIAALTEEPVGASPSVPLQISLEPDIELAPRRDRSAARTERRVAVRHNSRQKMVCQPSGRTRDRSWPAKIQDVSTTGICLLLGRRFEPGATLLVELRGGNGSLTVFLVRVQWVKETSPRKWTVGCRLDHTLSPCELESLV
jgi:serine/threonine protein kinase